jgi:uncharacterized membrane protein
MAVLLGLDSRRGRGGELGNGVLAAYYGLFAVGFGLDTLLVVQRQTSLAAPVQTALFVAGGIAGAALVWSVTRIGRKGPHRRGDLFLLYLAGYFLGRLWVESLRIDTANLILGLRVNEWTSILAGSAALVALYVRRRVGGIPPNEPPLERADGGAELVVGAQLPAGAAIALRSSTTDVSSAMPPSR